MFACTKCLMQSSIVKRLMQYECDSARAKDKRLASARLLVQKEQTVADLQEELERLRVEQDNMHEQTDCMSTERVEPISLISASKLPVKVEDEVKSKLPKSQSSAEKSETAQSLPEQSSDDHDESGSGDDSHSRNCTRGNCPHLPGFKELCSRTEKFSGRTGDCDFELWLEGFEEASRNCGWTDKQQEQCFSWFITGPAKTTWHRTLSSTERKSWKVVKKVYLCQYVYI